MNVIDSFTACSVTLHLRQDFSLSLTPPNSDEIQSVKGEMQFKTVEIDEDDDFQAKGGRIGNSGVLKFLQIVTSKNAARVNGMSTNTEDCFEALYQAFNMLYARSQAEVDKGVEYVDYHTITKIKLDTPLYGIFSVTLKGLIAQWKDLNSGMLLNVLKENDSLKENYSGAIDLSENVFQRLYDGQEHALVIPSRIEFTISIPTNYYKLSHYKIAVHVESVEDFQNNVYFVTSDFPYSSHIEIIEKISEERLTSQ